MDENLGLDQDFSELSTHSVSNIDNNQFSASTSASSSKEKFSLKMILEQGLNITCDVNIMET